MTEQTTATATAPARPDTAQDGGAPDTERSSVSERSPSVRVGMPTVGLQRRLMWVFLSLVTSVLALNSLLFFLHARHTHLAQLQKQL